VGVMSLNTCSKRRARRSVAHPRAGLGTGEPGRTRLEGIEGLRGLAAGSILVYHVWLYSQPGRQLADFGPLTRFVFPHLPLGVTLFFTLSAFLLYRPIVVAIVDETPQPRVTPYLINRGLRILPAYWVVLAFTAILLPAAVLRTGPYALELGRMVHDPGLLLSNVALVQNYWYESLLTGITPAWSLAVEAVFYLVLPLLGLLAAVLAARTRHAKGRLTAALAPAAALLFLGLSGKAVAAWWVTSTGPAPGWDGDWHSVVVRSFWGQADLFTFGMVLAVVRVGVERGLISVPHWWQWPTWGSVFGAAAAIAVLADRELWSAGHSLYELTGALGCALLLALVVLPASQARAQPHRLVRLLNTRMAVIAGVYSYSVFLWHEPLVRLLRFQGWTFPDRRGLILNLLLVATLTAIASVATYNWVERPALQRKSRPSAGRPIQTADGIRRGRDPARSPNSAEHAAFTEHDRRRLSG
jgi:peptidoglycan/LPS O-acetylase OafA/YrhL